MLRKDAPPPHVLVKVHGSDCFGEWTMEAMRLDYKKPRKGKTWRWVDENGIPLSDRVDAWESIEENSAT